MDEREREMLDTAIGLLEYQAGMDHWCDDDDCTIDNPRCYDMHTRAALAKLCDLADPEMKTLHPSRMTNLAERVFVEEWQKENERCPQVNGGFTTLEHILDPAIETNDSVGLRRRPAPPRPSQRDAEVATTLIQWLGTNCGKGFVERCERRIEAESAERSDWWRNYPFIVSEPSGFAKRTAERIVSDNVAAGDLRDSIRDRLVSAVAMHLQALLALYAMRMGLFSAKDATALIGQQGQWHIDKTIELADKIAGECKGLATEECEAAVPND